MRDYEEVRVTFKPCAQYMTDLLAQYLGDAGYDTFVPDQEGLTAYIATSDFDRHKVDEAVACCPLPQDTQVEVTHQTIPGRDWNEEWEKNYFQPIVVGDKVAIHSSFHKDVPRCDYDIVIDPKMAFGTGHHATTTLMLTWLLSLDVKGKRVLDMGTGTGILAIMAKMLGAKEVTGIEIDPDAAINARENTGMNQAQEVQVITGDASALEQIKGIDLFLANINRNVILNDLPAYKATLAHNATVIFSGFYEHDIPIVVEAARKNGLVYEDQMVLDKWTAVKFKNSEFPN